MGREIHRVALDFDWPLNKPWKGYLSPDELQGESCRECRGSGQTAAGWWLQHLSQRFEILAGDIGAQERGRPLHPWIAEDPYPYSERVGYNTEVIRPSEDMAELLAALEGHNDIERVKNRGGSNYAVYKTLIKASGIENWGQCKACEGKGVLEEYEGQFAERDAWKPVDPPAGEGWQLWETVSEGSPISPVCATREEFIAWLMNDYYWGSNGPLTKEQAENFVESAWAPSFIVQNGEVTEGIKAL